MPKKIKQKSVIVFDVSDYSIEIIEAHFVSGAVKILNQGRILLQEGLVRNGEAINVDELVKAIAGLMLQAKIADPDLKDIILVLPASQLFYQLVEIVRSDFPKRKELIREKLLETTPINKEELNFIYQDAGLAKVTILRKNKENLKKFFTVSFKKSFVQSWNQVFKKLNLRLRYFDLDLSAYYFGLNLEDKVDTRCVLDFGAKNTNVFFWQKDKLRYAYTFFWGGEDLTRIIEKYLTVNFSKAEELKKEFGLIQTYKVGENKNILYPLLEEFWDDLKVNIVFYEENYISTVKKIVLIGGGSNLKGLKAFLINKNFKKREIKRAEELKDADVESVYLNSYGAALGFLNKKYKDTFYIPANSSKNIEKDFSKNYSIGAYIKRNAANIKKVNLTIKKESRQFYFVLFFIVVIIGVFALFLFLKGKSDQEFLAHQAKFMVTEQELKEREAVDEKKEELREDEKYIKIKPINTFLRIRGGAGTNFAVVGKTEGEKEHRIIGEDDAWVQIEFDGVQVGWVSKEFVDFID